jgi:hypothetical protein
MITRLLVSLAMYRHALFKRMLQKMYRPTAETAGTMKPGSSNLCSLH